MTTVELHGELQKCHAAMQLAAQLIASVEKETVARKQFSLALKLRPAVQVLTVTQDPVSHQELTAVFTAVKRVIAERGLHNEKEIGSPVPYDLTVAISDLQTKCREFGLAME